MANETFDIDSLAQILHIDSAEEKENAAIHQKTAEQYLVNAGCILDYGNASFKGLVISITAKLITNPDLLTNLSENTGMTLNGMIAQCRMCQAVEAETS